MISCTLHKGFVVTHFSDAEISFPFYLDPSEANMRRSRLMCLTPYDTNRLQIITNAVHESCILEYNALVLTPTVFKFSMEL